MLKQLIVQQTSLQEGDFGISKEKIEKKDDGYETMREVVY